MEKSKKEGRGQCRKSKSPQEGGSQAGMHKTGIHGIQDTRQIVDSATNDKENNDKKGGVRFLNMRQLMKKAI